MRSPKREKIELNREYPCPCKRKGVLIPIVLTEALGCSRCQEIFVLTENGHIIEQLSSTYPYKRSWYWNKKKWLNASFAKQQIYIRLLIGVSLILLIIWLPLIFRFPTSVNIVFWVIIVLIVALLPAVMVWFSSQR